MLLVFEYKNDSCISIISIYEKKQSLLENLTVTASFLESIFDIVDGVFGPVYNWMSIFYLNVSI